MWRSTSAFTVFEVILRLSSSSFGEQQLCSTVHNTQERGLGTYENLKIHFPGCYTVFARCAGCVFHTKVE